MNLTVQDREHKIPGTKRFNVSNVSLLGHAQYPAESDPDLQSDFRPGPHQFINPNCFSIPTAIGQNGPSVLPAIYGPAFFNSDLGLFKNFQFKESKKLQLRFNANQFPESSVVVVQRKQPESRFRSEYR